MEKSKTIFEHSKEFIKGKQKNLILLFLIPMVFGVLYEIVNGLTTLLLKVNIVAGVVSALVLVAAWASRYLINVIAPFASINYVNSLHTESMLGPIDSYKIGWKKVWHAFVLQILRMVVVGIGFVALIVPGIYLGISFALSDYAFMVKGKGPRASLIYSFHIMQKNFKEIILKTLYVLWRIVLVGFPALMFFAFTVLSFTLIEKQLILAIILALVSLIIALFFVIKVVKVILAGQEYMYQVFLGIEKTKGEITADALMQSEKKLMKWVKVSVIIVLALILVGAGVSLFVLGNMGA